MRVVAGPDGPAVDPAATRPGRGAYLCSDVGCWQVAARRGRLQRALRTAFPREAVERLLSEHRTVEGAR